MFVQLPKSTWVQPLWLDTLQQIQASRSLIAGSRRLISEAKLAEPEATASNAAQRP